VLLCECVERLTGEVKSTRPFWMLSH